MDYPEVNARKQIRIEFRDYVLRKVLDEGVPVEDKEGLSVDSAARHHIQFELNEFQKPVCHWVPEGVISVDRTAPLDSDIIRYDNEGFAEHIPVIHVTWVNCGCGKMISRTLRLEISMEELFMDFMVGGIN